MSSREMNNLDRNNIIDLNAPRSTRENNSSRVSSTMVTNDPQERNLAAAPPNISPIREGEIEPPLLESSRDPDQAGGEFLETPFGTGRWSYRDTLVGSCPVRSALSSTESEGDPDPAELLIAARQDVDRYANAHDKAVDWIKNIPLEATRILTRIEKVRSLALDLNDVVVLDEAGVLQIKVRTARVAWLKKVSDQVPTCSPPARKDPELPPTLPTKESGESVASAEAPPAPPPPQSAAEVGNEPVEQAQSGNPDQPQLEAGKDKEIVIVTRQLRTR